MLPAIDAERNRSYWDQMRLSAIDNFESFYQNLTLADEIATYLSLEERAHWCLSDAFELYMCGETTAASQVTQHAKSVLLAALERDEFEGYQQAKKINGYHPDEWQQWYLLKGRIGCNWKLHVCSLFLEENEQRYMNECIREMPLLIDELMRLRFIRKPEIAFDDYWYIWALGSRYDDYVSLYESFIDTGHFKFSSKASKIMYGVSRFQIGGSGFEKSAKQALKKQLLNSQIWHTYSVRYPWWHKLSWGKMFLESQTDGLETEAENVFGVLKGI